VNLRIPGPTPVPDEVLQASAAQMMNHRGPEFAQVLRRVTDGLNWVFDTSSDVLSFTASGTGGLEVAVVNTLSPGDRVLSVSIGSFGERLKNIARPTARGGVVCARVGRGRGPGRGGPAVGCGPVDQGVWSPTTRRPRA
jgi:aspartate aminotransferase-like enzyme